MLIERVNKTPNGAILYDPEVVGEVSDHLFSPAAWRETSPVGGALRSGGRGTTWYLSGDRGQFVLRQYLRGGLIGGFVRRAFVWSGADNTRSFREWRLLAKMISLDLPVPRPAAARYVRSGPFYIAEIITVRIPNIRSLADRLLAAAGNAEFWRAIGVGIGHFHAAGVNHPDLNAYNVQLDPHDEFWLLDFDRGKFATSGPWRQHNVARFHRSLQKIKRLDPNVNFSSEDWAEFLEGYFSVSRSA